MKFDNVQKGLLPIIVLPCALVCYALYRWGKRPLLGTPYTSHDQRLDYLCVFMGPALLGEFLFQAIPNSTNSTSFVNIFVLLGFFLLFFGQRMGRVWHDNPNYVSREMATLQIRHTLNPDTIEINEYGYFSGLDTQTAATDRVSLMDEIAELGQRRRIAILTILIMYFMLLLEGLFLVQDNATAIHPWIVCVVFWIDKLVETLVIVVSLQHGYFSPLVKLIICSIWCLLCGLSTLPAVLDVDEVLVGAVATHAATSIFYALVGGLLWWVGSYYLYLDQHYTNRSETIVRGVIFVLTGALSWTVGFFY